MFNGKFNYMFKYMFNYWVIYWFISRRSGSSGQGERGQVCSVQCMSVARTLKTGLQNCVAAAGERKQCIWVQCGLTSVPPGRAFRWRPGQWCTQAACSVKVQHLLRVFVQGAAC